MRPCCKPNSGEMSSSKATPKRDVGPDLAGVRLQYGTGLMAPSILNEAQILILVQRERSQ